MILASGFSRLALRIAWRAWRSASAVTAQVLTMIASERPAAAAWPRITSLSKVFKRQPMVMRRVPRVPLSMRDRLAHRNFAELDLALEAGGPAASHHHVVVRQPFDGERAAIEHDLGLAAGKATPCGRDQSRASAAAAGLRDAGAAFPDPHPKASGGKALHDLDIGALRKQRRMLEFGADRLQIDRRNVGHKEDGM